jgi:hypothetical protein
MNIANTYLPANWRDWWSPTLQTLSWVIYLAGSFELLLNILNILGVLGTIGPTAEQVCTSATPIIART